MIDSSGTGGAAGPLERVCGAIRTGEELGAGPAGTDVGAEGDDVRSWTGTDVVALARVCMVRIIDAESERDEVVEARSWSNDSRGGNNMIVVESSVRLSLNSDH